MFGSSKLEQRVLRNKCYNDLTISVNVSLINLFKSPESRMIRVVSKISSR